MAIQFARLEFVGRSKGGNACRKSAYNGRQRIQCEKEGVTFDFSHETDGAHHEVVLPKGVNSRFSTAGGLWNAVEFKEERKNSQLAKEMVIALPDDPQVTLEDKIEMTKGFIYKHFVDKGLAAQIDIHSPHNEKDHNWHAHVLITTRRFAKSGEIFGEKARDLHGTVRKGKVVEAERWGQLWSIHQNEYFEDTGLGIRVDPTGIVPQEHLGPVRMRARAFALLNEHVDRQERNAILSSDPGQILSKLTEKQSLFNQRDVESFLQKYVPTGELSATREMFWKHPDILQLVDGVTGNKLEKFTSKEVRLEENRIIRLSDRLAHKKTFSIRQKCQEKVLASYSLNDEQKKAFKAVFSGDRIACIEGRAGTGKSYLLGAIREAYEMGGYRVRGLSPTSEVAKDLEEEGFSDAENIHRFLFAYKHQTRKVEGREVWIIDEAGMIGNAAMQELLREGWKNGCQMIFVGDSRQLPSIDRGGMFEVFCQKYGAELLEEIRRQEKGWQRKMASQASKGNIGEAINYLNEHKALHWSATKQEAMEALIKKWDADQRFFPGQACFIMEHRNRYAKVLNEIIHQTRMERGELGKDEFKCETFLGTAYVSKADRVQFRANDRELGVTNGLLGVIIRARKDEFVVRTDKGKEISFNPGEFHKYQLGYAGTYHRSQGKTVDRAYALHSPWMNRNLFYVGLTRHRKQFHYFVSREEASNLTALKYQASRPANKETSAMYQTVGQAAEKPQNRSFVDQAWRGVKENLGDYFHRNRGFYKREIEEVPFRGKYQVTRVEQEAKTEDTLKNAAVQSVAVTKGEGRPSSQEALCEYLSAVEEASVFKDLSEREARSSNRDISLTKDFKTWQKACGDRNRLAYGLLHGVKPVEKEQCFSSQMRSVLEKQAQRFPEGENRPESSERMSTDLYKGLNQNIEELCYRLFPDGPTHKTGTQVRFRANQSLSLIIRGEKAGMYYDFAEGEGGGLLKLIQKELCLNEEEAIHWTKEFLNHSPQQSLSRKEKLTLPDERKWISLQPDAAAPEPLLKDKKGVLGQYIEVARHSYRDSDGGLLYYVLRLQDRGNATKKITPPLSYGYFQDRPDWKHWRMKGYGEEKRTLYNAHLLKQQPEDPVLIVEGEKTADAGSKQFPEYIVLSWPGGAGAVSKADWSLLEGRRATIWPDNDEAGFKAAGSLSEELKKVDAKEIKVVSKEMLNQKFSEKWDLADPLPEGITKKKIQENLHRARKIDRGYAGLFDQLYPKENRGALVIEKREFFDQMQMFEEIVEESCLASRGVSDPVYQAYRRLLDKQTDIQRHVHKELGIQGVFLERVSHLANIFYAQQGKMPARDEIEKMVHVVRSMEQEKRFEEIERGEISKELHFQMLEYAKKKALQERYGCGQLSYQYQSKNEGASLFHGIQTQYESMRRSFETTKLQGAESVTTKSIAQAHHIELGRG